MENPAKDKHSSLFSYEKGLVAQNEMNILLKIIWTKISHNNYFVLTFTIYRIKRKVLLKKQFGWLDKLN
jgi:hypothetical protein